MHVSTIYLFILHCLLALLVCQPYLGLGADNIQAASPSQALFIDGFESGTLADKGWKIVLDRCVAEISSERAYSGTKSLKLRGNGASNYFQSDAWAAYVLSTPQYGTWTCMWYDGYSADTCLIYSYVDVNVEMKVAGVNAPGSIGQFDKGWSARSYIQACAQSTAVKRSVGWHKIEIRQLPGKTTYLYDGAVVCEKLEDKKSNGICLNLGVSYSPTTNGVFFDDVSFIPYYTTKTVSFYSNSNGSLNGTTSQIVDVGGSCSAVAAIPYTGYHFAAWSGCATSTDNPLTVSNVQSDMSITASFAINSYTLTYASGANGSINGTAVQTVNHGGAGTTVTAIPSTGYRFVSWSDGGTCVSRTDSNITGNLSVTANFASNSYTVTFAAGANGSLTGTAPQTVNHGSSGTAVTAVPAAGYHFVNWTGTNGFATSTSNPLTVTNVQTSMTITASFAINSYTLTYAAGANGSINGTTSQTVNNGSSGTAVTAIPATGYHFVKWSDGVATATRTDANITGSLSVTASFAINSYTLTYAAGANGSINGTAVQKVNHGGTGTTVTAVPATGYHFMNWSDGLACASRTDSNITCNISVTASFAINSYTVTFAAGANGSLTGTAPQTVNHGASGSPVTAVPAAGYHFVNWTGTNGFATSTANPLTVTNVQTSMTITASFAINSYTATYKAETNGSINGTTPQTVNHGGTGTTVTAVPATGYHFMNWSDGLACASRTDSNITCNISVTASFAINSYTVTFAAGVNGTLTGTAPQTINHGASGSPVSAVPSMGYHFVNWTGTNGFATSTSNPLTVTNVQTSMTITASFAINSYTLTYTPAANGSISGTSTQTVNHGANGTTVTAIPSTGYHFVSWSDGITTAPRTDSNITGNISVTASFAINSYTAIYMAEANGSISGTTPQTVNHGASGSAVTAVPATGYHFVSWSDGVTTASRTDSNITGNLSVTASFAINSYTLTYTAEANGSLNGTTPQTVNHGAGGSEVSAIPSTGYHFVKWSDGVTTAARADSNVTGSLSVTASFAINMYAVSFTAAENGAVEGAATQSMAHGSDASPVAAKANEHYHFVNWTGVDGFSSEDNPMTLKNIVKDVKVTANFAIDQVFIKSTAGIGGKIEPAGDVPVDYGTPKTFTFAADSGYRVSMILVDSVAVEADKSYNFSSVTTGHVIGVTFAKAVATLTMTTTGDGSGTVSPPGATIQKTGAPIVISASPDRGSFFAGWTLLGDGVIVNPNGRETTVELSDDAMVAAIFSKTPVKTEAILSMSAAPSATGTTSPNGSQTVKTDNPVAISATPASGYAFSGWMASSANAWIADAASASTVIRIYDDTTLTASFKPIPSEAVLTLKAKPVDGGTVSPSGSKIQKTGVDIAVKATPAVGYSFAGWQASGPATLLDEGAEETTVRISGDATLTAMFTMEPPIPNVHLTMAITPADAGSTYPAEGLIATMRKGTVKTVAAVPVDGFVFLNWLVSGALSIDDSTLATMDVTVDGDGTLTAQFAAAQPMVATVSFTSNHAENAGKGNGAPTSTDTYTIIYKATLPADFTLPEKDEVVPLGITFGDFVFLDTTDNAAKQSYNSLKGGQAVFQIMPDGAAKPYATVTFKWTSKRQLLVTVKGTPPVDDACMVNNIIDLTGESAGKVKGNVSPCSFLFGETEFSASAESPVPWSGSLKVSKDGLQTSWNIKGGTKYE